MSSAAAMAEGVGVARRLQSIDTRLGLSLSPSEEEEEGLAGCHSRTVLAIVMTDQSQKISSVVVVSSVYAESSVVQSNRPYSNLSVCVQRREIHERDTVKRNRSSRAKTPRSRPEASSRHPSYRTTSFNSTSTNNVVVEGVPTRKSEGGCWTDVRSHAPTLARCSESHFTFKITHHCFSVILAKSPWTILNVVLYCRAANSSSPKGYGAPSRSAAANPVITAISCVLNRQ